MHDIYGMIQVQLVLRRLYNDGNDEGETIKHGIQVQRIQKFGRVLVFWYQGSEKYRHIEVDADLEKVSARESTDCEANRLTPIPAMSGFGLMH
jgi:hypothetical protein